MKADAIREMSPGERERKLADMTEELFNLRFQHATGQLENTKKLIQTKRDIARLKTVIQEKSLTKED